MTKLIVLQFLDKASEIAKQSLERTKEIMSQRFNQEFMDTCLDAHREAHEQYQQEFRKLVLECYNKMNDEDTLYIADVECKPTTKQDGNEFTITISTELEPIIVPKGAGMERVYAVALGKRNRLYGPFTKDLIDEHLRESGELEAL
jgi:hypothetical protein